MVDQISRTLGQLESSVEGLKDLIRQQSEESRESRKKIYAKLEDVALNAQSTNARVADLEDRLAKVEPAISEIAKWKERAIGARMTIAVFWVTLGGAITSGAAWLWAHIPFGRP